MSSPDHGLLGEAKNWLEEGRKVAIATVIETWGSAPQPTGSQLVIDDEGNFIGSVSGGFALLPWNIQSASDPLHRRSEIPPERPSGI